MTAERSMISRAMAVIECCLDSEEPVPLAALVARTGLAKATAWRIAEDLVRRGMLQRIPDGYVGGMGLVDLGNRAAARTTLREAVTPALLELHERTRAAVWIVDIRSDDDWPLLYSAYDTRAAESRYAETWQHSPHDPAVLASALGLLAFASRPTGAERLLRRGVPRLTVHTTVGQKQIEAAISRAGQDCEVVEHERFRLGWSCLAVPVTDRAGASRSP